jgi:hypothetical protein
MGGARGTDRFNESAAKPRALYVTAKSRGPYRDAPCHVRFICNCARSRTGPSFIEKRSSKPLTARSRRSGNIHRKRLINQSVFCFGPTLAVCERQLIKNVTMG